MIDFSNLKDLFIDGKKVAELYFNGKKVKMAEQQPKDYLKLTSLAIGGSMSLMKTGTPDEFSLEYSTDDGNSWQDYAAQQILSLNEDKSVMFRRKGNATTVFSNNQFNYWHFVLNGTWKASGNVMSLLDASMESTTVGAFAFVRLFTDQSTLVDASRLELPATTLAINCYYGMFSGCTSLTTAPELPATELCSNCYQSMFQNCTSLSTAPELPATELAVNCYQSMFQNCTRLSSLTVHLSSWRNIGINWVSWVNPDGKFFCGKVIGNDSTIERGANRCPANWLVGNYDVNGYDMQNAFTRGSYTSAFLEDGSSHVPNMNSLSVFNGETVERLYDMTQYTVQLPADTTTAGTKTIQFNGSGDYFGTKEISYRIIAKNLSNCTTTVSSVYDNDEVSYLEVVQPDTGYTLVEGTDYTVAVSTSGGQSTVTITGIGNWSGTYTTTVPHKTSGTTPVAIYKHSPESQNPVYVRLQSNGGPINTVAIDEKPMSDPNASWTQLSTSYVSDSVGFWLRARDTNQALATGDNNYLWIDCGYDQSNAATVDISGDIVSLIDRSQTQTAISASNTFNSTFQNNDKILDASKLSCSAKTMTATDRAMRRLFASRGSRFGALGGNPQILTAIPEFEGLSVTTRGSYVYLANFQRCTALTSVTMQLPWPLDSSFNSDIANQQFVDCTGLVSAVVKSHFGDGKACPDSYLARVKMLDSAFGHCTSLTCISTDLTAWPGRGFVNWLADVAATGTFICPTALGTDATIQRGNNYCPTGWTVVNPDA